MQHFSKRMLSRAMAVAVTFILSVAAAFAQGQYALLTHEGQTTVFRGADALINANNAATDGDIITLSAGQFNNVEITKGIEVRGAGIDIEGNQSVINEIKIVGGFPDGQTLKLEGLKLSKLYNSKAGANAIVDKCEIGSITYYSSAYNLNVRVIRSIVTGLFVDNAEVISSVIINNCYEGIVAVNSVFPRGVVPETAELTNCIIVGRTEWKNWTAKNCVFIYGSGNGYSGFKTKMEEVSPSSLLFTADTPVFKDGSKWYELTDANAESWLGNDGRQVGIYGGVMPFDPVPSTPRFSIFKVDEKTNTEGILNVEIRID